MVTRIFDLLDNYQEHFSDKKSALVKKEAGEWISYSTQDYIRNANLLAYAFLELGFKKGDRVI
ncbi:MAG: long-chain acyl-CoA synthetase, partial [Ancylomarina sp.]